MDIGTQQFNVGTDFGRADLSRGLSGDASRLAQITRGDTETDRGFEFGREATNAQLALQGISAAQSVSAQRASQELSGRNEIRTERDFQDLLARYSITDRVEQAQLEEQFLNADFRRQLDRFRIDAAIFAAPFGTSSTTALTAAALSR